MKRKPIFNRFQLIGLLILLFLFGLAFVGVKHYEKHILPKVADEEIVQEDIDNIKKSVKKYSKYPKKSYKTKKSETIVPLNLHSFDPNTADSITLIEQGLRPYVVSNILKYRKAGGSFKYKEKFQRIYGMQDSVYAALEQYLLLPDSITFDSIRQSKKNTTFARDSIETWPRLGDSLASKNSIKNVSKKWQSSDQKLFISDSLKRVTKESSFSDFNSIKKDTILELNSCDTTELKYLRGIGSFFAKKIVSYRKSLGGFYALEQLYEIDKLNPDSILLAHFVVDTAKLEKIFVNRQTVATLRRHPYISTEQAISLYDYRHKYGSFQSLYDIQKAKIFSETELQKLSPYIDFTMSKE